MEIPKPFTPKEREKHIKSKYFPTLRKLAVLVFFIILFAVLIYFLAYFAHTNQIITFVIAFLIIILFPVAIFVLDMLWWESA